MSVFDLNGPGVYSINLLEPFIHSLPSDDEQCHTMVLLHNLVCLNHYTSDYNAAVGLHRQAEHLRKSVLTIGPSDTAYNRNLHMLKLWDEMAGREAAMTVFHFGTALSTIRSSMRNAPTLMAATNHQILRQAAKQLEKDFPKYELTRHAASHRAEAMASLDELKKHALNLGNRKQFLMGSVTNSVYTATFEGQELNVALTDAARQKLSDIMALAYSAFPTLAGKLPLPITGSMTP